MHTPKDFYIDVMITYSHIYNLHIYGKIKKCKITSQALAERVGKSSRQINRYLKWLESNNFIKRETEKPKRLHDKENNKFFFRQERTITPLIDFKELSDIIVNTWFLPNHTITEKIQALREYVKKKFTMFFNLFWDKLSITFPRLKIKRPEEKTEWTPKRIEKWLAKRTNYDLVKIYKFALDNTEDANKFLLKIYPLPIYNKIVKMYLRWDMITDPVEIKRAEETILETLSKFEKDMVFESNNYEGSAWNETNYNKFKDLIKDIETNNLINFGLTKTVNETIQMYERYFQIDIEEAKMGFNFYDLKQAYVSLKKKLKFGKEWMDK